MKNKKEGKELSISERIIVAAFLVFLALVILGLLLHGKSGSGIISSKGLPQWLYWLSTSALLIFSMLTISGHFFEFLNYPKREKIKSIKIYGFCAILVAAIAIAVLIFTIL